MAYRYSSPGEWLKGNTHIHTTFSDGGRPVEEVAKLYAGAGYDFLFCTDHWHASNVQSLGIHAPLLLDGIELDGHDRYGAYYHIVCLGKFAGLDQKEGLETSIAKARAQGGLIILAHPYWIGNTREEALRHNFDGVEIYNHVCRWLNGKSDGGVHWNAMLVQNSRTLGFASDDAHLRPEHPGWNGGWIKVKANARTASAIISSVRAGNFFSSCGPDFLSIECQPRKVRVTTSAVPFIRLVGPGLQGKRIGSFDGKTFTEAEFDIPSDWKYAYIEIEDAQGRRAWTNNLLLDV